MVKNGCGHLMVIEDGKTSKERFGALPDLKGSRELTVVHIGMFRIQELINIRIFIPEEGSGESG